MKAFKNLLCLGWERKILAVCLLGLDKNSCWLGLNLQALLACCLNSAIARGGDALKASCS